MEDLPINELAEQIFFSAIDSTVTVALIQFNGANQMLLKCQREMIQVVNGILDFEARQTCKAN